MKNKQLTYVMGVLVIIVWGLIIYRVFNALSGDDDSTLQVASNPKLKEAYNDYATTKDTAKLLLNYRDPFGLQKQKDTATTVIPVNKVIHTQMIVPVKPAMNWSFIQYNGFVRNPGSKKLIALININGKSLMLAEGETAERVKLLKNLKDSIKVLFDGKTKFITMNTANP